MVRRDRLVAISLEIRPGHDRFRVQRTWRVLFGLYQDCACIRWSRGFKKQVGRTFTGRMRASMLPAFLHEAISPKNIWAALGGL